MSKNNAKTAEELLQEALVPVEEQPYPIPENWLWARLSSVFKQVNEQIDPTGTETYIGLEHLKKGGGITERGESGELKSKKVIFKEGDVLYGKLRPYLNKHAFVNFDGVASTDILVFRNENKVLSSLLDMYFNLNHVIEYANMNSNGINLPRVSPKAVGNLPFPLPPRNEQKRIVEKVGRLLNKINQAKQLIEEAKETFELRRAAILDKAFHGEFTTNWRVENISHSTGYDLFSKINIEKQNNAQFNGKSKKILPITRDSGPHEIPNEWMWNRLGNLSTKIVDGTHHTPTYVESGVPFLSVKDVRNNELHFDNSKFISEAEHKILIKRCNPEKGDVLITKSGTIGRTAVVNTEIEFSLFVSVALIKINGLSINPKYVELSLEHLISKEVGKKFVKGTAVKNLHLDELVNLPIPLPSLEEQDQIVDNLKAILDKEAVTLLALVDLEKELITLQQTVLSRAFNGKLGTNNPVEENAVASLISILLSEK